MPATPSAIGTLLPFLMDKIYKRSRVKKVSHVEEQSDKLKSHSVPHITHCEDDHELDPQQPYRHSESAITLNRQTCSCIFDYNRILKEERKDFQLRLKDIPEASGHLDDFLIKEKLGSGRFGDVYLAEDKRDKNEYAIKFIRKKEILENNLCSYVKREIDYLYATNSPFIVSLIQHFEDENCVYLVQEYVNNGNIYEHLKHRGPFSEELARFYVAQVVLALEYLHNVNLIYRDLKPENVMVSSSGYIKLVDFGLVKRQEGKTIPLSMVGTPVYMAPEMFLQKSYDKAIDWWSLGIFVYEMLAGCGITPFYDPDTMVMREKMTSMPVTFPVSLRFPKSVVRDLIKRLLKVNTTLRLGTGTSGSQDVKNHPWFAPINWVDLYRRTLTPPKKRISVFR